MIQSVAGHATDRVAHSGGPSPIAATLSSAGRVPVVVLPAANCRGGVGEVSPATRG